MKTFARKKTIKVKFSPHGSRPKRSSGCGAELLDGGRYGPGASRTDDELTEIETGGRYDRVHRVKAEKEIYEATGYDSGD